MISIPGDFESNNRSEGRHGDGRYSNNEER